jgi:hypothetical protein
MRHLVLLTMVYKSDVSAVFLSLLSWTLLSQVASSVRPALNTFPTSMVESAQRISAMNSNLYYAEVNMPRNFQQNSSHAPQTTSSSYAPPSDFYYGFGSTLRIPSPDPQNIEGLPMYHKLIFWGSLFYFQGLVTLLASTARIQGNPLPIWPRHRP